MTDRQEAEVTVGTGHRMAVDTVSTRPKRVLMVVALLVGFFTPGLAYLIAWALIPEE